MIILFFSRIRQSARTIPTSLVVQIQKKVGENAPLSEYYKVIRTDLKWHKHHGGPTIATNPNPTHHLAQLVSWP